MLIPSPFDDWTRMSRRPDPDRKPQLLADTIDYLLDKPLASLTFRTLAHHLEVSTFTLVYHFGTKSQLVNEVVEAVCAQQYAAYTGADVSTESVDDFFATFRRYWQWTISPRNRQLQRLEFEAAMAQSLEGRSEAITHRALRGWHSIALDGMQRLGVPDDVVRAESRAMASLMYGLQYDHVLLGETQRVDEAFERVLEAYRVRIHDLVGRR